MNSCLPCHSLPVRGMESKGSKNMFQILIPRYLRSVLGIPDGVSWLREMNIKISKIGYLIYSLLFLILLYSLVFFTDGGL